MENKGIWDILSKLSESLAVNNNQNIEKDNLNSDKKEKDNFKNSDSGNNITGSFPFFKGNNFNNNITNSDDKNENSHLQSFNDYNNFNSSNFNQKQNKEENTLKGENSFLKSYNPFLSPMLEKKQIVSPPIKKPVKNIIDINNKKNYADKKISEANENIVKLIARHNSYIKKIKDKN